MQVMGSSMSGVNGLKKSESTRHCYVCNACKAAHAIWNSKAGGSSLFIARIRQCDLWLEFRNSDPEASDIFCSSVEQVSAAFADFLESNPSVSARFKRNIQQNEAAAIALLNGKVEAVGPNMQEMGILVGAMQAVLPFTVWQAAMITLKRYQQYISSFSAEALA
jgi:hypothetical protein